MKQQSKNSARERYLYLQRWYRVWFSIGILWIVGVPFVLLGVPVLSYNLYTLGLYLGGAVALTLPFYKWVITEGLPRDIELDFHQHPALRKVLAVQFKGNLRQGVTHWRVDVPECGWIPTDDVWDREDGGLYPGKGSRSRFYVTGDVNSVESLYRILSGMMNEWGPIEPVGVES